MSGGPDGSIGAVVDRFLAAAPTVPAACVAVDGPEGTAVIARGRADPEAGVAMTGDHAVRVASCTKTFVAVAVVRAAARGLLALDQPAVELAPPAAAALLAGRRDGSLITVRQLLQHRSGLVDHTYLPAFGETLGRTRFAHEWTAQEQLELAFGSPALFPPGTAYSYSDSGYVLLGQIVEAVTSSTLAAAVRDACDLDRFPSIHWEQVEAAPAGLERAHQHVEDEDIAGWSPTLDLFGGGGLVATMPDVARWWSALFDGSIHDDLTIQLDDPRPMVGPDGVDGGGQVGLGLFRRSVDGVEVWGHGGFWGLMALHVPALRTSVALVLTRRGDGIAPPDELADEVVRTLAR